jgi:ketosteroid isomerase-like protein
MSERDRILFAHEAFYLAFRAQDLTAMNGLWDEQGPISCVHPGWSPLTGREAIMASWQGIFSSDGQNDICSAESQVQMHGDMALVTCFELLGDVCMTATNLFVRRSDGWRLVHHQAGACYDRRPERETPLTPVQ